MPLSNGGCHSFAPFGAYPCGIQFPGRCPGLTYQCPLRGVTNTHPRPLPKGGDLTPTSNPSPREGRLIPTPNPSPREGN